MRMTTGEVATILGISRWRVAQLDSELEPTRTVTGRRIYDAARVEKVRAERAARARAKAAPRERKLARIDEIRERAARVRRFVAS